MHDGVCVSSESVNKSFKIKYQHFIRLLSVGYYNNMLILLQDRFDVLCIWMENTMCTYLQSAKVSCKISADIMNS